MNKPPSICSTLLTVPHRWLHGREFICIYWAEWTLPRPFLYLQLFFTIKKYLFIRTRHKLYRRSERERSECFCLYHEMLWNCVGLPWTVGSGFVRLIELHIDLRFDILMAACHIIGHNINLRTDNCRITYVRITATGGVRFPARDFLFSTGCRPALGSIQYPVQWVLGAVYPGNKAARAWSSPITSI
jgi:hypothetical protein